MIIQHNVSALNAHRQLATNNTNISKSLEKLSSGYRINRAGDDAAGLAISEKMRGQISGLAQATRNAQDGISLIQTGEGALQETHSILQRMRELAVQSANGTYDDANDRVNLNKEVTALKTEIDRIASSTQFNGTNLLDGTMGGYGTTPTTAADFNASISALTVKGGALTAVCDFEVAISSATTGAAALSTVQFDDAGTATAITGTMTAGATVDGVTTFTYSAAADGSTTQAELEQFEGLEITVVAKKDIAGAYTVLAADAQTINPLGKGVTFQIGANGVSDQRVTLSVGNMSSKGIGVAGVDVASRDSANLAISTIDAAINSVSGTRADLGALQNRMEHTINSLGVAKENLTASESRIRDVDMAQEMMSYTKNNILSQAAQAMLAQANTLPQGVLQLLG